MRAQTHTQPPGLSTETDSWRANIRPPLAAANDPADAPAGEALAALERHNQLRARHGLAALSWDPSLALSAAAHAASCLDGARPSADEGIGESAGRGAGGFAAQVDEWYGEVSLFTYPALETLCDVCLPPLWQLSRSRPACGLGALHLQVWGQL